MINKLLGFRRASHEDVPDEIVLNLSHKLKDWIVTSDVISPIWANLISKYDSLNPNRWDDNKKIKSELEAFYTSGLSDGADVGIEMKKISTKLKYYFRGRRRYKVINNLLKFMQDKGANCAYSIDILTLQKESGRPWLQKINGDYYNPELFDHLLFYFYIHEEIKKYNFHWRWCGSFIENNSKLTYFR